jgi:S-adenosylmethionine:tRNA ribosyltransferase-isomerase
LHVSWESKDDTTHIVFQWEPAHLSFAEILKMIGEMPIPPYLKRASNKQDETRYQSVFASEDGSVAAPTASLHFTEKLLSDIQQKGCDIHYLTLHVGAGTFKPVKSETIGEHAMHAEWMELQLDFIEVLLKGVIDGRPVYCVGTTSLRTLESIYWMGVKCIVNPDMLITELPVQQWEAYELPQNYTVRDALQALIDKMKSANQEQLVCQTAILITPVYQCRMIQGIFTNFHQPASTLLLLVASITGLQWKKIYTHALQNEYRFLSYGDGCLLHVPKAE